MRLAACLTALTLALSAAATGVAIAAQQHESQITQQPQQARPADVGTAAYNLLRDDWDAAEPGLSPATLQGGHFGQLFATHVDGQVYAQPLVVDSPGTATTAPSSSVIVATENNTVYSIDGTTGKVNWSNHLGIAWSETVSKCSDLGPQIGITSTPVYDPATHEVYVVADVASPTATSPSPAYYVYALNEQTGLVAWRAHVGGHPANAPAETFVAARERQRTGLLLMNGWLYFGFASFCDYGSYTGFVDGVNVTNRALQTMWTAETGSAGDQAGIWMSGGGLMSDGPGRIFFATGNGVSPPPGPGTRPPGELGDSVVRLSQNASTGVLTASDFFSPADAPNLDRSDSDLGAGGTIGLPFGTSTYPHLLLQAGKDHRIFLLNRDSLGGRETGPRGADNPVFIGGPYGGQWGHPAAYDGASDAHYVYYLGAGGGVADYLRVLHFNGQVPQHPVLQDVANSPGKFGFSSGSPVVTSNRNINSSAVVWVVYDPNGTGIGARLEAYNAVPAAGHATLTELWSAPIGTAAKFSVPTTDGGHVYLGTRSNTVYGFGASNALPLTSAQASFGSVTAGATKTVTATVTATRAMEVTGLSASSTASPVPFTLGTPAVGGKAVTFPVALTAGQQLAVPVTFAPAAADAITGSLDITTNVPGYSTVSVPLAGTGTVAGLAAFPTSIPFGTTVNLPNSLFNGPVPTGGDQTFEVDITNTGTTPETITTIRPPAAPFSIFGLKTGTVLRAGQDTVVGVTYTPTRAASSDHGSFTIGDSTGHTVTVPLTGISVPGNGVLVTSQPQVQFGTVPVGTSVTDIVRIINTGNLPVTVTVFLTPAKPFSTPVPLAKGLAISPDDIVTIPVQLTPQTAGTFSGTYQIAATYGNGKVVRLALRVSGKGA